MLANSELIVRLLIAALLGSLVGVERERLAWAAGLRTHMLVCVGSTLIMIVSAYGFADVLGSPHVELDPSRMAAQVVSGIGFLGAGSILLRNEIVRGLTTAASLWSVAAIGLAVGGGLYMAAITATAIILIILAGIKPLERRYFPTRQRRELRIEAQRGALMLDRLHDVLGIESARLKRFIVQHKEDGSEMDEITIVLTRVAPAEFTRICNRLKQMDGVVSVEQPEQ
jgi:putative Mg2+ transporter-C (MgtC) family protein